MKIQQEYNVDIATAHSRLSKKWKNATWKWSALVERCSRTTRTDETAAEYARMSREEQGNIKDVGGFVGGYLSQGVRKTANVLHRTVATLDIDFGTPDVWDDFCMSFDFAAMLYSTHKHSEEHPRYRLVFPLSRPVRPEEYEPLCRKVASAVGMDLFDDSTYELARLFYWPSTSKDAEFVFQWQDGPACDVDAILSQYVDFRDASAWPVSSREGEVIRHEMKKAGDPTAKGGVIGAFCRAYSIEDAIEGLLAEYYEPTDKEGRYTYTKGSVAGGLVCYEGKFAFSHHDTDPAGRRLCNAFDLCRIHLFGEQDEGSRAQDITRMPSYLSMMELAREDKNVRLELAREQQRRAAEDFADVIKDEDDAWKGELDYAKNGELKSTIGNIVAILENDPTFRGRLTHDEFSGDDERRARCHGGTRRDSGPTATTPTSARGWRRTTSSRARRRSATDLPRC